MLPDQAQAKRLKEIALSFLKLGTVAFGGPAAHTAMMEEEFVRRRKWVDRETFMDLLGAANLIPGPNSTELAIHLGLKRAGWLGLLLAGTCFILPAMLIVLMLAVLYTRYGYLPQTASVLYGIKPVIIAVILQALWNLKSTACKNRLTIIAAAASIPLGALGVNELLLLLLSGLFVMLAANRQRLRSRLFALPPLLSPVMLSAGTEQAPAALGKLFWLFLKIGSVLYGSGYVLIAFLQADFVDRWGVLTARQLLDAVAIGQFTPGPLFTTATFVGYLIAGIPGALLATLAIFLPAFLFVALTAPWLPRLRQSPWTGPLLDGVNAASVSLMALVTVRLGSTALVDGPTVLIGLASFLLLFRYSINSAWLVLAGGLCGFLIHLA
ncbi:chromate efflux transporter [Brevibacillus sp. SYP-B805]|uniref:chromate efflux transporter n=1 Tax=Brevibacillus sp. SYP-B805 TaxID=1578199 RepID=UPI0013ED86BC|nr:chromate efflux transporter [Brevibacillus sp. SYP-B805]NGQ95993.1 chromate efflux transporter [Brevibacillus sp. SYP-B805]